MTKTPESVNPAKTVTPARAATIVTIANPATIVTTAKTATVAILVTLANVLLPKEEAVRQVPNAQRAPRKRMEMTFKYVLFLLYLSIFIVKKNR